MSILASICSNLGVNVQKYSLMGESMKPVCEQRSYLQQKTWVIGECLGQIRPSVSTPNSLQIRLGLLLVIFGSLGDFAALGFAPQSLITPVGGLTMVFNILFAHYWLGEALSRRVRGLYKFVHHNIWYDAVFTIRFRTSLRRLWWWWGSSCWQCSLAKTIDVMTK